LGAPSLLGKLAPPAESIDFHRTAQQCEPSQDGCAFEKLVHFGYLDILYPSAADAQNVMMRFDVAVIARDIVEERHFARLSHFAELLQNPMDRGQRYVGMPAAHRRAELLGARMVVRSEQGLYDGEPLGCDGNPPLTASGDEVAEPLSRIFLTPRSIEQPELRHKLTPGRKPKPKASNTRAEGIEMTADRLDGPQAQPIPALTCN
jgi:hypothetical protein